MAFLLGCEKVRVEFPTKEVLSGISLGVDEGDRIGIVGRNGEGKSTLLNLLAGALEPDEGRVLKHGNVRVGLLSQADSLSLDATVLKAIVGDKPEYEWAASVRIRAVMSGLLGDLSHEALVGDLSGGQRRRVDLARLLIGDWDVLALDEPTNHLDVVAINWLAQHLKKRWKQNAGALLVVTHDRWFLDEVCSRMWEVHQGGVEPFEGGFSAYIMQRVERERLATLAEQKRQNELRRELAWLSRGARARATKPKFHVAVARDLIADVPPLRDETELKRMAIARLGKQVVDVENVVVRFGSRLVLNGITWLIGPGDRFGILGENGAGKTTLLRLIQGLQQPSEGVVKRGKTVRFAVLSQHLDDLASYGADRVRQVIGRYSQRTMVDGKEVTPAQLLEKLGFTRDDLNEPVCDLSGGQKRRLALMLILLDQPNVLILDEPGNDLDTDMLASLEALLDGWPGTLLLVTHDRFLMERVTDHQYALMDGKLRHLPGGVDEYLGLVDKQARGDEERSAHGASVTGGCALARAELSDQKLSGKEIHALRKLMQSNERKMTTLRKKIEDTRCLMNGADPSDFVVLGNLQSQLGHLQTQMDTLEDQWLAAAEKLQTTTSSE